MKRLVSFLALLVSGCVFRPPHPTVPLRVVTDEPAGNADRLVVFLRGRSNQPEEFLEKGLFSLARQRWPDARFVAPDLHLGYYYDRIAAQRLHDDVIAPARAAGVAHVSLVGISLGGLGALLYELEHPGVVDEIILLSPYLGEETVWKEIVAQGGLEKWNPGVIAATDYSRRLWSDLRQRWLHGTRTARVQIACGARDPFIEPNKLFAQTFLPSADAHWIPGGHDWPTWRVGFGTMTEAASTPPTP